MIKIILGSALLAVAMANQQYFNQPEDYANPRQGLGGSANIGFGDFGSVGASADLQVPGDINFLSTIIYGLGGIVLVNTIVSIATALWPKGDATEEATEPEEQSRRMRQIIDVGQQVFEGIQKFAQKYNQH